MARNRDDKIYWVLQERSYLFFWKAHSLYKTRKAADHAKLYLEAKKDKAAYKVDRVELVVD